jgi:ketol-acid reductoisomerase
MNMITLMRSFKLVIFMMRITIIGFGNQAKAWTKNLKDSTFPFQVALRTGSSSFVETRQNDLPTVEIGSNEFYQGQAFALLTPDHTHQEFLQAHGERLRPGSIIIYAHGFSLIKHQFQQEYPHLKHILFAPKAIGSELRNQYIQKGKLGAVYSLEFHRDDVATKDWLLNLANALGINMGPYHTSFIRETQADLFSEQGLLCSLIPYVAREMFNQLIDSGIEPELAYFECWHELKLIVSAMVDKGPEGFFDLISPNALIGSEKGYERLITADFKQNLQSLFTDIKSGAFNEELESTDIEALRTRIRTRWSQESLTKTFAKINQVKE